MHTQVRWHTTATRARDNSMNSSASASFAGIGCASRAVCAREGEAAGGAALASVGPWRLRMPQRRKTRRDEKNSTKTGENKCVSIAVMGMNCGCEWVNLANGVSVT